ncbi:hypothetical protein M422DRAFT_268386 [Sphaerobolus stellatus SS14]|uniref:Uncharacterized protein n=1 Tax=Sphaerobolus stellatus (strain SS14) TaxID=990650 RepID=A0A0C9U724_SPHS4|nr:hypothetical protein M422DRAFT_268386 [Sphaerobolus stellatus SS14]
MDIDDKQVNESGHAELRENILDPSKSPQPPQESIGDISFDVDLKKRQDDFYPDPEPQIEPNNELSDEEEEISINRNLPINTPWNVSEGSDPLTDLFDASFIPAVDDIRLSVEFIRALQAAKLDNGDLDPIILERLRNPPDQQLKIEDEDELYFLEQFLATS